MRRYHILAAFLIVAIMLSGCAIDNSPPNANAVTPVTDTGTTPESASPAPAEPASPATAEPIAVTFGAFENERARYKPLIDAFEKENPAIHVQFVPIDALFSGANVGPLQVARDILSAADTTAQPMSTEALENGWLLDLKPLMDADAGFDPADFYPGALESVSYNNGVYILPRVLYIPLLFYNKTLWAAKGLKPPSANWTWTDLKAATEQLAHKDGDVVKVYGLLDWEAAASLLGEFVSAKIERDPAGLQPLDDPAVVTAFKQVAGLLQSGAILSRHTPNGPSNGDMPDSRQIAEMIGKQQIGIWTPILGGAAFPSAPSFEIEAMPFPADVAPYFGTVSGYSISRGSKHPEAAWKWIAFLSRQAYTSDEVGLSAVPARQSLARQNGFWDHLSPSITTALKAALNSPAAKQSIARPKPIYNSDIDADLIDTILRGAMSGGPPIQAMLHDAQQRREQRLAQQPAPSPTPEQLVVATPIPEAPAGSTTITFGAPSSTVDTIRRLAVTFNQNSPGTFVNVVDISGASGLSAFEELSNTTDCFLGFDTPDQASTASLLDLQPLIDADFSFKTEDFPPAMLAPFRNAQGLYGLPYTVAFRVLNYNWSAFDALHLSPPTGDWTVDDLLSAAQQLTHRGGQTKQYGFAATRIQPWDIFFFLDRSGASTTKGSGATLDPDFTNPQVVQAIRTYLDLLRTTSPNTQLQGYIRGDASDVAHDPILGGQVAMWFDFGTTFLDRGPREQPGFEWAIAPPPLGKSAITANDFVLHGLYISAKTQNSDACWSWIKTLSNDSAGLGGSFPARISLADSSAFTQGAPAGAAEVYKAYRAALGRTPVTDTPTTRFDRSTIDYYWFFRAIDRALQGKDLEHELADAQKITEQFMMCLRNGTQRSACATQVDPQYQGL